MVAQVSSIVKVNTEMSGGLSKVIELGFCASVEVQLSLSEQSIKLGPQVIFRVKYGATDYSNVKYPFP